MTTEVHFKQIESKIVKQLNDAQNNVVVAVAWITSPTIIESINKCLQRKVKVRLLSVNDNINSIENFTRLYYSGANIRLLSKKLMHNKFCLIDNKVIITGSYNWTVKASSNHENITITYNNFDLIDTFIKEFEEIWKRGEEISTLIPINKDDIYELESEFDAYLENIKRNNQLPYIFFINESFKSNPNITKSNFYGNIQRGFYLIKDDCEEYDFFRYLFFSKSDIPFSKINQFIKIPSELKAFKITNVITSQEFAKDSFVKITENLWVEFLDIFGEIKNNFLAQINSKGEISAKKYRVNSSFKNSYIIQNNDVYQIFTSEGKLVDFNYLNIQKPTFGIYVHSFLDEKHFLCDVLIENENEISKKAIFDTTGKMVSDPIFYHSIFKRENERVILEETPVLFIDNHSAISTILHGTYNKIANTAKQSWLFHKRTLSKNGIAKITHVQLKDTHTALYVHDEEFGPLYLTISFLKTSWNVKYVELAKLQYQRNQVKKLQSFYDKINASKQIVQEVENREKLDIEKLIRYNKQFEKNNSSSSDFCFVATAIYGDLNHPKTVDFRIFREKYLKNTLVGRKFIVSYYIIAPSYVRLMKRSKVLTLLTRNMLFIIHSVIIKKLKQ